MKKVLAVLLMCVSVSVFAYPNGEHLHGGFMATGWMFL